MAKTYRKFVNRTLKFLIIMGIIIYIDSVAGMTSTINMLIIGISSNIFGLNIENTDMYMSLYAAVAVLLSSNIDVGKKLWYSIVLIITYFTIFIFLMIGKITYPYYLYPTLNLILTLIVFITMTFPILLWIMLDDEGNENEGNENNDNENDGNENDERLENNKKIYGGQHLGIKNKSI